MSDHPGLRWRPGARRGSQAQRPQIGPIKEPKKVRQPLAVARAEDGDQTFSERQLVDGESMAGLLQRGQVIQRTLLVGRVSLDRVDDDHGVQVVQHSRSPRRGPAAGGFQFHIPLGVLGQAGLFFGAQVFGRPAGEAA
jgi:hypothetical protein